MFQLKKILVTRCYQFQNASLSSKRVSLFVKELAESLPSREDVESALQAVDLLHVVSTLFAPPHGDVTRLHAKHKQI